MHRHCPATSAEHRVSVHVQDREGGTSGVLGPTCLPLYPAQVPTVDRWSQHIVIGDYRDLLGNEWP